MNAKRVANSGSFKKGHIPKNKGCGYEKITCSICGNVVLRRKRKNRKSSFCSSKCFGISIRHNSDEDRINAIRDSRKKWKINNKERSKEIDKIGRRKRMRRLGIRTNISKNEDEFYQELIKSFSPQEITRNNRDIIRNPYTGYPLELDFYIPSIKTAYEINGICHRKPVRGGVDKLLARIKNDNIKKEECQKLGINLIVINV